MHGHGDRSGGVSHCAEHEHIIIPLICSTCSQGKHRLYPGHLLQVLLQQDVPVYGGTPSGAAQGKEKLHFFKHRN